MKLFFWNVLFLFSSVCAEIVQIRNIDECKDLIKPEMLLVFDIDNTIMEPVQLLGSDQWFSYQIEENIKRGMSKQEGVMLALGQWVSIQNKTKVKPVELSTAQFIENLQKGGWKVMGLTTRGLEMATKTLEQLKSIGIDFDRAAPFSQEIIFEHIQGAVYRGGVLFSIGTNKGPLLFQFFKQTGYQPKKIFFVDDKEKYLRDVENHCAERQIPFVGIRYGFLDEKVKNLRPELASEQWKCFGNLISDAEAEAHLKSSSP
jgi:hypothetical protein